MWLTIITYVLTDSVYIILLMFTSPCATFVVSVKKNIVIYTVTTKTYIYITDITMFIYLSCICDWVLAYLFYNSNCQLLCAMKKEFFFEINLRGQNLFYS